MASHPDPEVRDIELQKFALRDMTDFQAITLVAKRRGGKPQLPPEIQRWSRVAALALALLCAACGGGPVPSAPTPAPPRSGEMCLADLRTKGAFFELAAAPAANACMVDTPVSAEGLAAAFATPATMSCALADRLMDFDLNVVQPTALQMFGRKVVLLRHLGAYACRLEASRRHDRLSQHAYGLAIDLGGFTLSDGTRIDVEKDWTRDDARGRFLRAIARGACSYFSVVLTPASNSLHRDHLHLDIGPDRLCSVA